MNSPLLMIAVALSTFGALVVDSSEAVPSPSPVCGRPECAKSACKRCSRCRAVYYCSTECQRADWKRHKEHCKPPTPEKDAATKHAQNTECPCCLEELTPSEGTTVSICGDARHTIHGQCAESWTQSCRDANVRLTCPVCRTPASGTTDRSEQAQGANAEPQRLGRALAAGQAMNFLEHLRRTGTSPEELRRYDEAYVRNGWVVREANSQYFAGLRNDRERYRVAARQVIKLMRAGDVVGLGQMYSAMPHHVHVINVAGNYIRQDAELHALFRADTQDPTLSLEQVQERWTELLTFWAAYYQDLESLDSVDSEGRTLRSKIHTLIPSPRGQGGSGSGAGAGVGGRKKGKRGKGKKDRKGK